MANADYAVSIAVFLNQTKLKKHSQELLKQLSLYSNELPDYNYRQLNLLLTTSLLVDQSNYKSFTQVLNDIKQKLNSIGAIERQRVCLGESQKLSRALLTSKSKLQSILNITKTESTALGQNLRLVILTDFIRKEVLSMEGGASEDRQFGVIPIFEMLRREQIEGAKLGVLTGSVVIVPTDCSDALEGICANLNVASSNITLTSLKGREGYSLFDLKGRSGKLRVAIMTQLFTIGGVNVLVGTKSLLGEGRDAPCINSLIMASFVGSFMLSNQMRGRAIRTQFDNPAKVSNIWHPVCVDIESETAGKDIEMLTRRFRTFVGPSLNKPIITNGIKRVAIPHSPMSTDDIESYNARINDFAVKREGTAKLWNDSLIGRDKKMVEGILVKPFPFMNRIARNRFIKIEILLIVFISLIAYFAVAYSTLLKGLIQFAMEGKAEFPDRTEGAIENIKDIPLSYNEELIFLILAALSTLLFIIFLPKFVGRLAVFIRNCTFKKSVKQAGKAILRSLCARGAIKTKRTKFKVRAMVDEDKLVFCCLEGGSSYENSVFLDSVEDLFSPIFDPRYLFTNFSSVTVAVPSILAKSKETVATFHRNWGRFMPKLEPFYTRSSEGKCFLIYSKSSRKNVRDTPERACYWR